MLSNIPYDKLLHAKVCNLYRLLSVRDIYILIPDNVLYIIADCCFLVCMHYEKTWYGLNVTEMLYIVYSIYIMHELEVMLRYTAN